MPLHLDSMWICIYARFYLPATKVDVGVLYLCAKYGKIRTRFDYYLHPCFVSLFSSSMSVIYQQHKDEDGFVYMAYSGENSMG